MSDFKLAKSAFLAKSYVLTPVVFFKSQVANSRNLSQLLLRNMVLENNSFSITIFFLSIHLLKEVS